MKEDNKISLSIQISGNKSNIGKKVLLNIIANLVIQDMQEKNTIFIVDKSDYSEYLAYLKNAEIVGLCPGMGKPGSNIVG